LDANSREARGTIDGGLDLPRDRAVLRGRERRGGVHAPTRCNVPPNDFLYSFAARRARRTSAFGAARSHELWKGDGAAIRRITLGTVLVDSVRPKVKLSTTFWQSFEDSYQFVISDAAKMSSAVCGPHSRDKLLVLDHFRFRHAPLSAAILSKEYITRTTISK